MFQRISKNSNRIVAILSKNRSPNQIAWSTGLGVMLGLLPKDNLIFIFVVAAIAMLPVNQLAACLIAISLFPCSSFIEPVTAGMGSMLLQQSIISTCINWLYQFPGLPWTCLENPPVLGGSVLGLSTLLPTYCVCLWTFSKSKQAMENSALEQVANDAISYRKAVVEQSTGRRDNAWPAFKLAESEITDLASPLSSVNVNLNNVSSGKVALTAATVNQASNVAQVQTSTLDTIASISIERPSDILKAAKARVHSKAKAKTTFNTTYDDGAPIGNDTILRETVIEVVRYRRPINPKTSPSLARDDSNPNPLQQATSMSVVNAPKKSNDAIRDPEFNSNKPIADAALTVGVNQDLVTTGRSDESLRYLLWHINGSRDSNRKSSEKTA